MDFLEVSSLLENHTTAKLIRATNASLIISFLFKVFKTENINLSRDTIEEKNLIEDLSDYLYQIEKEKLYPKSAKDYLNDWTNSGYLRKYITQNDIYVYELTPAIENAFSWITSLTERKFIGQESRLKNLFESIKELSINSKTDYESRIKALEDEKAEIEAKIEDAKNGYLKTLDNRQIKEQYYLIEETGRILLSDFKQVEQNFRDMDRNFRQKVITTTLKKGQIIDNFLEEESSLLKTDQGRSFEAFWEFFLVQSKNSEFENYLNDIVELEAVKEIQNKDFPIQNIRNKLIDAGAKTKNAANSLVEQLRKYLEHKSFFENKRIHDNIQEIFKLIGENPELDFENTPFIELDKIIKIDLMLDKPLFEPPEKIMFSTAKIEEGIADVANNKLYDQFEIDIHQLKQNIKKALQDKTQISMTDFLKEYQVEKGVAEVLAYVNIAHKSKKHIVYSEEIETIIISNKKTQKTFSIKLPQIIFNK